MNNPDTRTQTAAHGPDGSFRVLDHGSGHRATIRFSGPFLGEQVTWDATVMTLAHYAQSLPLSARLGGLRPFIEACAVRDGRGKLIVVLDLAHIDSPALRNTVVMVRQWKRLGPGRHEYGQARHFH